MWYILFLTHVFYTLGVYKYTLMSLHIFLENMIYGVVHFCDDLPKWIYGNWSQCSKSCGEGRSYRTVACVRTLSNDTNVEFNSSDCRYLKQLETVKTCLLMQCPAIKTFEIDLYQIKSFTPARILVGMDAHIFENTSLIVECRTKMNYKNRVQWFRDGIRVRNGLSSHIRISKKKKLKILQDFINYKFTVYTCRVGNFSVDSKVFRIPHLHRNISVSILTNTQAKDPSDRKRRRLYVSLTPWTICSQQCGFGVQTRDFKCEIITDKYILEFPKSDCSYQDLNITLNKTCYIQPCVKWKYTSWSPCTKRCGSGVMNRSVNCVRMQPNGTFVSTAELECDNLTRYTDFKKCNLYNCSVHEIVKKDLEFYQLDTVPKVYLYILNILCKYFVECFIFIYMLNKKYLSIFTLF
ncbi:hypothetical protein KUTeg_003110 [Tegillarca granosa]|uniref:Ig-like domain-containing protein n=1 Tax=Tegillarca granosa TaxID=220873 RepID=A0ABQ9FL59_TEGGR|nr:hypothetical protein KUTeg_003110 [Tegillarca granosa]